MSVYYVVHAGGNWGTNATFSTTFAKDASRTGGAVAPTNADTVICDDYSGALTVNTTTAKCAVLDCMSNGAYASTLTFTAAKKLTVSGSVTFSNAAGFSTSGTGTLAFDASGTFTTNTKALSGSLTIAATCTLTTVEAIVVTGTITLSAALTQVGAYTVQCANLMLSCLGVHTISGNWTVIGDVGVTTGTATVNGAFTIYIGGDLTLTAVSINGTATLEMTGTTGTAVWSASTGIRLVGNPFNFNAPGQTITLGATIGIGTGCILTWVAGTINQTTNSSVLSVNGVCTLNAPSANMHWYAVTVASTAILTLSANIICDGTITLSAAMTQSGAYTVQCAALTCTATATHTLTGMWNCTGTCSIGSNNVTFNGQTLNVSGSFTQGNGNVIGTTAIVLNGTGTWSVTVTSVGISNPFTINTTGTITFGTYVAIPLTFTYSSGTLDLTTNNNTVIINNNAVLNGAMTWNNIVFTYTCNLTLTYNLVVNGTLGVIGTYGAKTGRIAGAFNVQCANLFISDGCTLQYTSGQTLTVTTGMQLNGSNLGGYAPTQTNAKLMAYTATQPFTLIYQGTPGAADVRNMDFTDVNITASRTVSNYGTGTLTRCTGIENLAIPRAAQLVNGGLLW